MKISVKVVPNSSQDCVVGWLGDSLKVRVKAPPEGGRANAAVTTIIAKTLDISPGQVTIVRGRSSPGKTLDVTGISAHDVRSRLPPRSG